MAQTLIWATTALRDIAEIADYIRKDVPQYADLMVDRFLALGSSIRDFPHLGRMVPEYRDPDLRERFVHSYRVLYRIEPEQISVIAVIHGKRLLEDALEGRNP